jgi:HTH-type transcriptional regulator/antitoxin HigA
MASRAPAEVFPPGEFLADELEARGWTQTELAEIIGRPQKLVNDLVNGKRAVTPETATDLAAAFGTTPQFWMNLETAWQLSKVAPRDDSITRAAALRERFPVREMMKRGWLDRAESPAEIERSLCVYFNMETINDNIRFPHAARRNYDHDVSTTQWAWIFRVNQLASAMQTAPYSEQALRARIPDLEKLMVEPEEIRHIPRILRECGVRFVIVEPIPASAIQGVCFWMNDGRSPVIGLTLKGDQIDKFWFDFWHELEHVLNGDGKYGPIIDDFEEDEPPTEEIEIGANTRAAEHCVPQVQMRDFILRHTPMFSEKALIGFSRIMKRHPGIIAGQIQRRTGRWELFRKHQPRIRHILIQTAMTDGYGVER